MERQRCTEVATTCDELSSAHAREITAASAVRAKRAAVVRATRRPDLGA